MANEPSPGPQTPDGVDVTVLVPCRNERRGIGPVVRAMEAQTFPGRVEFLLLDGGSTDGTVSELAALSARDPRFRLVERPGANLPERLNVGLRTARGEWVARMDAHAVFPPRYLEDGVRRIRRGDVASVSGPQVATGDGRWSRRIALALRSPLGTGGVAFRGVPREETEVFSGYCGLWRREDLLALGGWNERATVAEDTELAARVRRRGGRIVCVPAMAARYRPREDLRSLGRQYWRYAFRRAWVARRYPEVLRGSQCLPPALVAGLVLATVGRGAPARLARRGAVAYALALLAESIRVGRGRPPRDVLALPAVFATIHLSWGAGFLASCLRHGPPRAPRVTRGRPGPP